MRKVYDANGVSQERSGFRDEWISQWHRRLGFDFPGADIDFLFLEYDQRIPVAIVDYKMRDLPYAPTKGEANADAIRWLADKAGCSFWWVFYRPASAEFWTQPMNTQAEMVWKPTRWLREQEFVRFLRHLRNLGNQSLKSA